MFNRTQGVPYSDVGKKRVTGGQRTLGPTVWSTVTVDWGSELRRLWIGLCLVLLLVGACGGAESPLTDYVESLNVIVEEARLEYEALVESPEGGVLVADPGELAGFTPQDLRIAFEKVRIIEAGVEEATAAIDPPPQVAELHHAFFDFDSQFIASQEALAVRAGSALDWVELSETPEMAAYRAALAKDKQECIAAQAEVNAIAEQRESFADTPWIPAELKEVFEVAFGCDGYPAHPEDVYRPLGSP